MIPIFDNAFSGINPDLFRLLSPELFSRKVLLLVRRDPRDQFADLVRYSGSTYPWNVRSFIKQYRIAQYRTAQFLERMRDEPGTMVRLLGFEEFVLDSSGARTALQADLRLFWEQDGFGPSGLWGQGAFHPEISAKNIGLWQESRHHGAMKLISRELREYLVPESERAVASAISKG
ncbi:MAG: hypothetical protein A2Z96_05825 [Spirochaetes bacterium GWB1_48_6]|nr:MAG: hypothetical protein A2Z96_05825 [Spirochaetes bacterium GWB1_48_6]